MAATLHIRSAAVSEGAEAHQLLLDIAQWLIDRDRALWLPRELDPAIMQTAAERGELYVGLVERRIATCMILQNEDKTFWPELEDDDSCFLHRLLVHREFAGRSLSGAMITFAETETRRRGRRWLRLDCDPRPELIGLYERAGFTLVDRGEWDGFPLCRFAKQVGRN